MADSGVVFWRSEAREKHETCTPRRLAGGEFVIRIE